MFVVKARVRLRLLKMPKLNDRCLFSARNLFNLDLHGTRFPVGSLFNLFKYQRDLLDATSYEVQSQVPREIFELMVKELETGGKAPFTKAYAGSISLLSRKIGLRNASQRLRLFK
jgi:hypothetical protein